MGYNSGFKGLMLFEGQAGETLERSGFLSYPFPVEIKVSRVCLVTFSSTHSSIDSVRFQTQMSPGRMFEKYRYDKFVCVFERKVCTDGAIENLFK